ncbi:MAG: class I SAM-dependent rRNA methyltransferase [Ignavibacteriales bacterium]|nr:class I SAM-dependent rRNA methyltransferase [Ignavibacteriales bacterium]
MKKQIVLKKNEEHRILAGHQWVFSNEVKAVHGNPESGDVIELLRHDEKFLGIGFYNPHSLIAFRLLSRDQEEISFEFFEKRIERALQLRKKIYPDSETFRVVHGEGDFLPGLVIDQYNEFVSLQTLSVGMDNKLTLICDVLESIFHPKAIVERNESPLRSLEQLPLEKGVLRGTIGQTIITENNIKYKVDLLNGQKTGFFLDQRENRKSTRQYVKDASVLDCFCNEGGFALNAALAQAKTVRALDISPTAIANAKVNATINEAKNTAFETADVFERLKELENTGERFDVVILDPPSFSRNKKTVATALKGYKEINTRALHLLNAGGILVSASCSHHITEESFIETIEASARSSHRSIQLLEFSGASPDHPSLPSMPETKYLKFAVFAVQ